MNIFIMITIILYITSGLLLIILYRNFIYNKNTGADLTFRLEYSFYTNEELFHNSRTCFYTRG